MSAATIGCLLETFTTLDLDWCQTRGIARDPAQWVEINVIFERHPIVARVSWYFGAGDRSVRARRCLRGWGVVWRNCRLGLKG